MQTSAVSGQFNGPGADVALRRRLLAVPAAATVNIYSLATHTLLTVLRGHRKPVSAARFAGEGDSQLLTASLDGTLCVWDVETGALSRSIAVGQPIVGLAVPGGGNVAHLSLAWSERGAGRVRFCRVSDGQMLQPAIRLSAPTPLAASRDVVSTHDSRRVLAWPAAPGASALPLALHHTKAFQCVAVSPDGDRLAAGDATGRILIWHGVVLAVAAAAAAAGESAQQQPQQQQAERVPPGAEAASAAIAPPAATTVHWHAHGVRALAFSLDAQRLLSGGDEAVLVTWRLADNSRSFLAHLGAPLTAVLPADEADAAYVVCRADNAICQVSTASGVATDVAAGALPVPPPGPGGTPPPPPVGRPSGSCVAAGGRVLAIAGAGGVLQLYDATAGRSLARLQVGQQGPAVVGGQQGPGAALQHLAFSSDGALLVTVDARQDAGGSATAATFLRFWRAADAGGGTATSSSAAPSFAPQAVVEAPHGSGQVSGLALHPTQQLAATSGGDGAVRLWAPVGGKPNTTTAWHCRATWTHRGSAPSWLAFSPDGSLLAAATPGAVALWDTAAGALATSLPHPPTSVGGAEAATHLVFAAAGPFLVAAVPEGSGTARLVAWNLLTLGVAWSAALPLAALAADPSADISDGGGGLVAAVHGRRGSPWKDAVLRLDAATGQVTSAWQAAPPVAHLVLVSGGAQRVLLAVTADRAHEAVSSGPAEQGAAGTPAAAAAITEPQRPNPLEAAFGATGPPAASSAAAAAPALQVDHAANAVAVAKRLFDRPSHLLRPAPEMAREFLLGLLHGQATTAAGG